MKTSQYVVPTAVKIIFVLFGVLPVIGLALLNLFPAAPVMKSVEMWLSIDMMVGMTLFLGYLALSTTQDLSRSRIRHSSMKIYS